MKIDELTVEVRNAALNRVGQVMPGDLVGAKFVLRFNNIGSWELSLRGDNPLADSLRAGGAGIIVTGPNGTIISGPTTNAVLKQTQADPIGVWQISGADDSIILNERLAYPTPSTADVTLQTSDYDTRTGVASTVIYAYVSANIGVTAPTVRKIANLTTAADTGLGSTVSFSARYETLGQLIHKLVQIDQLGFDIMQVGSNLRFRVFQPQNLANSVRMDIHNNRLESSNYAYSNPTVTRAIMAGQGDGAARTMLEVTTAASLDAESTWSRRIEQFIDSRGSGDTTEMTVEGTSVLNQNGTTITALSVQPTDMDSMRYQVDWNVGDTVSVVVGLDTITQIVQEVGISVETDGVRVIATVGFPEAVQV